jgi:hypothetical protein
MMRQQNSGLCRGAAGGIATATRDVMPALEDFLAEPLYLVLLKRSQGGP